MMNNQGMGMANQMQQMNPNQVIDHDENLSDKEIYPGSMHQQVSKRSAASSRVHPVPVPISLFVPMYRVASGGLLFIE